MDKRQIKAKQIAETCTISKKGNSWIVPSQSGKGSYIVYQRATGFVCNCPDYELRHSECKHCKAVQITILQWFDNKGNKIAELKRVSGVQNWSAYNKSQIEEKERFMTLLKGLVETIPEQSKIGRGRPNMPVRDLLFASALKVYSQFSLRRFQTDLALSKNSGYVDNVPCYSLVGKFMEREDITPILYELVMKSSLPLKSIEDKFAVDSSGFRTTTFSQYCVEKHHTKRKHEYLKAHICTGVNTNIITSCKITDENGADITQFRQLVQDTHNAGFDMQEVSADKIYNSVDSYNAVSEIGGVAFIPYKSNTTALPHTGNRAKLWRKMFFYFQLNRDEFLQHYHLRSNVESTFFMLKAKFNDALKSKLRTAQVNELLLKILCHNIVVVNSAINEFNIAV